MRVIGITCGIGSMLVGAKQAGFQPVGNIEWRRYYHTGTFQKNFPGAFMVHDQEQVPGGLDKYKSIDYAVGHPECGNFSNLRIDKTGSLNDPGDIPLFVKMVARIKPRFFLMDDLPKSFYAFTMKDYVDLLPEYDLFPEWVSNFYYGNVQKARNRFFLVGALKQERFVFRPGEAEHDKTLQKLLGDLMDPATHGVVPNHHAHRLEAVSGRGLHVIDRGHRASWMEMRDWFAERKEGQVLEYYREDGQSKNVRMGFYKAYWGGHSHVLTGTNPILHPVKNLPFTIRERARIQGFPDDFVFIGETLEEDGTWNHDRNNKLVKQTGKAMPVDFCRYVARQVRAHIEGVPFECSDERLIRPNEHIDRAKRWFCQNVGYADQKRSCDACWMFSTCSIRHEKYGVGPAPKQMPLPLSKAALGSPVPTQVLRGTVEEDDGGEEGAADVVDSAGN